KNFLSGPTFQKLVNQREIPIIAHFTLKGNFIASQSTPPLYLDGDDFAQRGAPRNLRDPIGDGRPGGDFEMWFRLTVPAPPLTLVSLSIDKQEILADVPGDPRSKDEIATGTVILSSGALADTPIQLAANPMLNFVSLPSSVTVPKGATTATFPIAVHPALDRGETTVQVTASFAGLNRQ